MQQTMSQLLNSLLTAGRRAHDDALDLAAARAGRAGLGAAVDPRDARSSPSARSRCSSQQWAQTGALNAHIEETYTGHALVKVFGHQREAEEQFAERNEALFRASFGAQFLSGIIMPAIMFIGNLNYVFIAVIGGLEVASGSMSLGDVQAFIQYSRQFSQPLTQVASMSNLLQSGVASAERVFELLDAEEQMPDPAARPRSSPTGAGGSSSSDVSFRYDAGRPAHPATSRWSPSPASRSRSSGPTGAGKTTLVNLIMRFYELDGGRITLDGVDVATMTRDDAARRDRHGAAGHVAVRRARSARTSRYGRPERVRREVLAAATATYVDRFVHSLPDGYDTVIDEEGSNVSAGERQLITIARAFLAAPSLLILDEATSSVDTRTEVLVQKAMAALRVGPHQLHHRPPALDHPRRAT